jgi:uncharacterized protein (TIGR02001 family)
MSNRIGYSSAVFAGIALCACSALAADVLEPAQEPASVSEAVPEDPWAFDVAFGAALTSDYMFRGITQTDHEPALQPYIESSYGIFYSGIWASNVDFGTPDPDVEIDLYGGLRREFGPLSADISYLHYFYPGAPDTDYGETMGKLSFTAAEMLEVGSAVAYAPDYGQLGDESFYVEGNATVSLPHDISLSGAVGLQTFGEDLGLSDYVTWNVGASYTWKAATLDLRYHDTDLSSDTCGAEYPSDDSCEARIVATVSIDTSWSALRPESPSP